MGSLGKTVFSSVKKTRTILGKKKQRRGESADGKEGRGQDFSITRIVGESKNRKERGGWGLNAGPWFKA